MTKREALRHAVQLWGRDAFVSRPSAPNREHRYVCGYISYGEPLILGFGSAWELAFERAASAGYTTERIAEVRAAAAAKHPAPCELSEPEPEKKPRQVVTVNQEAKTMTITTVQP